MSVIKCNAMKSVMALVVHKKCDLLYLDLKMMFLNGDMKKKKCFHNKSKRFLIQRQKQKVCKFHQALYRISHTPKAQYEKIN
jgi:hypothetical protein